MSTVPPASAVNSRPSRSASGRNGCTVAFASVAARFTAKGTNSPRSASTTCSAMVWPALSWASTVDAPRCGVTTTVGSSNSGDSVVGSVREHVERGAGDPALAHGVGERGLVDDAAAGGVDDPQCRLGVGEQLGRRSSPTVSGVFGRWMVRKSARRDELLDGGDELDAELAGPVGAHVRVVGDELHPERVGALRDEHADPAEPDDAERLVVQLDALPPGAVPLAVPEVARRPAARCGPGRAGARWCAPPPTARSTAAR